MTVIVDAQVHAPNTPHAGRVRGMDAEELVREMDAAGVQRACIVPLAGPGETVDNAPALAIARADPGRFRVMGLLDLKDRDATTRALRSWREEPMLRGFRIPFVREPYRGMLAERRLGWLWSEAERSEAPLMVNAPGLLDRLDEVAAAHPALRLAIDHLGVEPFETYAAADLLHAVDGVVALARHERVAVKASGVPCTVAEPYPFPSTREPLRRVIDAYGPHRVFWGSDLTRLPCSYREAVRQFTDELPFLRDEARDLVLGGAIMDWLGW